jgi:hypothetical protein
MENFSHANRKRLIERLNVVTFYKRVWLLVALLAFARIVGRILLPNSFVVPDESTWSGLTTWISDSGDKTVFEGFDRTPYFGAQALVLPSVAQMHLFDITSLDAVRNTSLFYGIGGIILIGSLIVLLISNLHKENGVVNKSTLTVAYAVIAIYGFLPSHFLWGVIGLRDSAAEFFVILVSLMLMLSILKSRFRYMTIGMILVAMVGLSASRAQVAWVMCAVVAIFSILSIKGINKRPEFLLVAVISFPLCLWISSVPNKSIQTTYEIEDGLSKISITYDKGKLVRVDSKGASVEVKDGKILQLDEKNPAQSATPAITLSEEELALLVKNTSSSLKVTIETQENLKPAISENVSAPINRLNNIPKERNAKRFGAKGVINETQCPLEVSSQLRKYLCEAYRLPYALTAFLLRPFIFETSTSQEFRFASVENVFWLLLIFSVLILALKRKWVPKLVDAPAFLFLVLFSAPASLTEGNFGTAVRHKSVVLWCLLYLFLTIYMNPKNSIKHRFVSRSMSTIPES